jgi:SAM-dependent methyltransferase
VAQPIDTAEYTARMRAIWGEGDYSGLAGRLAPAAAQLVEAVAPDPAHRVLDLAAGTGNVAILVAARGTHVVAADLSPRMVELGSARTAGLPVEWLEADAERLPLPDASVDAVLSSFGLIFAPRPEVALAQAHRVLAPGGTLGFTVWRPDGFVGEMISVMSRWLPTPPGIADGLDWGREPVVAGWLAKAGFGSVGFRAAQLPWRFESPAALTGFLLDHSPTHRAARSALGERAGEMLAAVEDLAGPPGQPVQVEAGYAVVTATAL